MSFRISTHICDEMKIAGVNLICVSQKQKNSIIECTSKKYLDLNKKGERIWEKLKDFEKINNSNAWKYIKDFIKSNSCIIFFNQNEETEMYIIDSGDDLNILLHETFGFEFYITDMMFSYLICYNHHDILYGCGCAKEWIVQLRNTLKR